MYINVTDHPNTAQVKDAIKTNTGTYYSGMTRNQIQGDKFIDKRVRERFDKIDKDKNGALSNDEIMLERKKEKIKFGALAGLFLAYLPIGCLDLVKNKNAFDLLEICFSGYIGITELCKLINAIKGDKEIKEKLAKQA